MQYAPVITFEDIVEEQIDILYDFCILRRKKGKEDQREDTVRQMLLDCGNERRIEIVLHDVKVGNHTLNELLKMKGYAI